MHLLLLSAKKIKPAEEELQSHRRTIRFSFFFISGKTIHLLQPNNYSRKQYIPSNSGAI